MANIWHDLNPHRIHCDDFIAVIEIEKGSKNKYELDKESGHIILDRILYTPQITDLFPAPLQTMATRLMFWCFVLQAFAL